MVCPKCQTNVADNSNFCPRCGTPFKKQNGFVANLWRDNKPGFVILSLLLVAMLGSIGYYLYSRTGKFVVKVESISADEALGIVTKATVKEYCLQFPRDCQSQKAGNLETAIKTIVPRLLNPPKPGFGYAKITYDNGSAKPVVITRFNYRRPPGSWTVGNSQSLYEPKIQRLRVAIRMGGENVSFQDKVDLALTTATVTNNGSITLAPREKNIWRLSNIGSNSEFQVEYSQDGGTYSTPILRIR
jgi:hypothetical protein